MSWTDDVAELRRLAEDLEDQNLPKLIDSLERDLRHLDNERYRLDAELKKLREEHKARGMVFEAPVYWKVSGDKKEGPFCQVCWDGSQKAVHLHVEPDKGWGCKVCGNHFSDDSQSPFRYNPPF